RDEVSDPRIRRLPASGAVDQFVDSTDGLRRVESMRAVVAAIYRMPAGTSRAPRRLLRRPRPARPGRGPAGACGEPGRLPWRSESGARAGLLQPVLRAVPD